MERLQKFIAASGITSRRKAEELITAGKVLVNGKVVKELGTKVGGNDEIIVDGISLKKEEKVYYLLNKPREIISAVTDDRGRKTVIDLINTNKRIFPVGRLDYDTSGILILTNDGELSNHLTHPSHNIEKLYLAKIKGFVKKEDLKTLEKGIKLDVIKTKPAYAKLKKYDKKTNSSYVYLTITEGRNHQVKNMFEALGYDVVKLKREQYAFLTLYNLKSGEYRELSIKEVKRLYSLK